MIIKSTYSEEPNFPATDQHPDCVRYKVGALWLDVIGGEPSQADVDAYFKPLNDQMDNKPVLDEIEEKEKQAARFQRALIVDQHHPGEISETDKALAVNQLRQLNRDISELRTQLK